MNQLIELQEQMPLPVLLTQAEREELRQLDLDVQVDSGWEQEDPGAAERFASEAGSSDSQVYKVNPGCYVGHFRLGSGMRRIVRITPKVGIRNVFALLGAAYGLYSPSERPFRRRPENVDYDVDKTRVLEPLVRYFNESIKALLQDGLLTNYVEREENLKVLRGRLAFSQHLAQNVVRQDRLYCRFFQAEVDIPENQVILWALILLNRAGEWSQVIRQTLHSHILHFGGVSLRQFLPRQTPVFHYDRLRSRYREVHDWCRLFIDLLSISDKPGETTFNGYLLDMNELFERFVISVFKQAEGSVPVVSVKNHKKHHLDLDGSSGIEPDLTLEGPSHSLVAVDAKYKRTKGPDKAKHPDLYQVISYCVSLGLIGQVSIPVQGILVYPRAESSPELEGVLRVITSKRPSSELSIRVICLDLDSQDPIADARQAFTKILHEISGGTR
jgi:5-methylcytosine-specific restriction enzyme subunit McrC